MEPNDRKRKDQRILKILLYLLNVNYLIVSRFIDACLCKSGSRMASIIHCI